MSYHNECRELQRERAIERNREAKRVLRRNLPHFGSPTLHVTPPRNKRRSVPMFRAVTNSATGEITSPPSLARTLLVSLETSVLESTRRCFPERNSVRALLLDELRVTARDDNDDRRVIRMTDCSSRWIVSQTATGPRLETQRCRERLCPECQRVRSWKYQQAYEAFIQAASHPKMLTLTLRTTDAEVATCIDKLYRCFKLLRRREVWKTHCTGGYTIVEVTKQKHGTTYHVHLHVLMDSAYIPVQWISQQWLSITGDSFRVDIRVADKGSAKYVAKYVTKGVSGVNDGATMWELSDQLKGRRMAQSFGDAPALNLEAEDDQPERVIIGTLEEVLTAAAAGDAEAIRTLDELRAYYGSVPGEKPPKPEPPDPRQTALMLE